ncbi:hypothetical protein PA01_12755 [Azoarcus sp. PA01]|nr:hypothetical protein PA01_12755 [Azoarcus sp. PA01]
MAAKELMSVRGYAKSRGLAHTTVDYHIRSGKLVAIEGKIDPDYADVVLREKINKLQSQRGKGQRRKSEPATSGDTASSLPAGIPTLPPADLGGLPAGQALEAIRHAIPRNFDEAQFYVVVEDLLKRRLANAEQESRLLDADGVHKTQFEMARQIRDAMMAIPPRLQDTLAVCTDPGECGRLLADEIRQALESAADAAGQLGAELEDGDDEPAQEELAL